jgi:hypothetical protein
MAFSVMTFNAMPSVIMLSDFYSESHNQLDYAVCHYAECHYAQCCYAE